MDTIQVFNVISGLLRPLQNVFLSTDKFGKEFHVIILVKGMNASPENTFSSFHSLLSVKNKDVRRHIFHKLVTVAAEGPLL